MKLSGKNWLLQKFANFVKKIHKVYIKISAKTKIFKIYRKNRPLKSANLTEISVKFTKTIGHNKSL